MHKGSLSKNQIYQETSFCVLQVSFLDFTNTISQLYIDFYTIRIVFESSFQLCIFKVANLKKLWQFCKNMYIELLCTEKHSQYFARLLITA